MYHCSFFISVQAVSTQVFVLELELWWMSREQSDTDYKPKYKSKGAKRTPYETRQRTVSPDFEGYASDSGISTFVNVRSPKRRLSGENSKERENRKKADRMAREKSQIEMMMEMFAKMREDDKQERAQLEEKREQERRVLEDKRERERKVRRDENRKD